MSQTATDTLAKKADQMKLFQEVIWLQRLSRMRVLTLYSHSVEVIL